MTYKKKVIALQGIRIFFFFHFLLLFSFLTFVFFSAPLEQKGEMDKRAWVDV